MKILLIILLTTSLYAKAIDNLPFIGKAYFSVDGGNGTEESIIIKKNGDTVITSHGKFSSNVVYKGKFTNPIKLSKDSEYLFIKNGVCGITYGKFDEYEQCSTISLEDKKNKFNPNFKININNLDLISFIKRQHFDYCPNANIGTVIDSFIDSDWIIKKQNKHISVSAKGQVLFMNIPQDVEFVFLPDIFNNKFSFQQLLLNGNKEEFLVSGLIDKMCKNSNGEEDLNQELWNVKKLKGENIEKYLLKYSNEQKYSNNERTKYYAKYINHYVSIPMEIANIEKKDTDIYEVQGSFSRGNNHVSIFMTIYTQNKKEALFLSNYKIDPFEIQKKILFKGKFKIDSDGLFGVSCYMSPAIMVLK